ncbi:MAG: DUF2723 domain-containing protein [Dehalococcoidia bacterium]
MWRRPRFNTTTIIALGLFGIALGVYVSALPPSITWSNAAADSGELAAAVKTWGVAHPPGYPTYILAGKLFTLLPAGDTAFRLNVMSAVFGAGAVAVTFLVGVRLVAMVAGGRAVGESRGAQAKGSEDSRPVGWLTRYVPPALGALALAFSPIVWGQSTVVEVYALNALLVAVIAYLLISWLDDGRRPGARVSMAKPLAAAFLFGLGMGNHFTLAMVAVPLAAAVLWRMRQRATSSWGFMALALALGLAVYIYLPVSAARNPPINWGDPIRWSGFIWEVSGTPYRGYVFGIDGALWDDRLGDWAKQMVDQFQGVGVVLVLVGAWRLWRWDRVIAGALALSFLAVAAYATFYQTADSFVFLIPSLIVGALAIAVGSHYVLADLAMSLARRMGDQARTPGIAVAVAIALLAAVPVTSAARNWSGQDLSNDVAARDYGREVFAGIEPNAIVLASTDQYLFPLWYQRHVVDTGSGITVVARNLLQFDWYVDSLRRREPDLVPAGLSGPFFTVLLDFARAHVGQRPLYATFQDEVLSSEYLLFPMGRLFKIEPIPSGL